MAKAKMVTQNYVSFSAWMGIRGRSRIGMKVNDVVQFTENHKWCGCLGIIHEVKSIGYQNRYLIGVPVPEGGTVYIFYIFDDGSHIEKIGTAILMPGDI